MKKLMLFVVCASLAGAVSAQKFLTRTGKVSFYSSTPLERIEAVNNEVAAVANASNGEVVFQVPVKSFKFEKALMQEHFNENYMESDKYPKAEFRGKISDPAKVKFTQNGSYPVSTAGKLTIHGVTRDVTVPGTIVVKDGSATLNGKFTVRTADYGIKIPSLVEGKIAKEIEVTVNTIMQGK